MTESVFHATELQLLTRVTLDDYEELPVMLQYMTCSLNILNGMYECHNAMEQSQSKMGDWKAKWVKLLS